MPVSTSKQFIYFVIPKCGSATVRNSIKQYTDIKRLPGHFCEHFTIKRFLRSKYAPLINTYFKFTFVRNPYDRIYSAFIQDKFAADNYPVWKEVKKGIILDAEEDFNQYFQKYVATSDIVNDWRWINFTPMHAFSHFKGYYLLNWFGRTENLENDLYHLSDRLDLEIGEIENKNVRSPIVRELKYVDKYDKKTIQLVNKIYRFDFEFFNYKMLNPDDFSENV